MKFGLFYELQLPKPWQNDDEHRLFKNCLEQIELADRLGYDYVWAAEHHFLEEYSHSSAPEVFLGAVSQRTTQIRIGHGIAHLTTSPPVRVAERAATLDLVSDGRLELGIGEGSTTTELHGFGVRFRDKREIWEDGVRALIPMLTEDNTKYDGTHWQFPMRNVVPKPLQKPHPPLWVACSQMETIRSAGGWGMGVLGFQFLTPDAARAWVTAYYNELTKRQNRLADYEINPNIAMASYFICCSTGEEAAEKADGACFFEFCLRYYGTTAPRDRDMRTSMWEKYQDWKGTDKGRERAQWLRDYAMVGSPATLRERLERLEATHIDQVVLLTQTGRTSHEDICTSLELFAREVMPDFDARDEQHQSWKRAVLSGEVVVEEIDTTPHDRVVAGLRTPPK